MIRAICFISVWLLGGGIQAAAQQTWVYSKLSVEQGLLSNDVKDVLKDNKGFMWVASVLGLQRYDGIRFTTIRVDSSQVFSPVSQLKEDGDGNIWCLIKDTKLAAVKLTARGHEADTFHAQKLQHLDVSSYVISQQGDIIILTSGNQLLFYNVLSGHLQELYSLGSADKHDPTIQLQMQGSNRVICRGLRQLFVFELTGKPGNRKLVQQSISQPADPLIVFTGLFYDVYKKRVYVLCRHARNHKTQAILYTGQAFIHFNEHKAVVIKNIKGCLQRDDSTVLIYSAAGIFRLQLPDLTITRVYLKNILEEQGYTESIRALFVDDVKNIWLCPASGGLAKVNASQFAITTYRLPVNNFSKLHIRICDFLPGDRLLLGIDGAGLYEATYKHGALGLQPVTEGLFGINAIYTDRKERVWVGTSASVFLLEGRKKVTINIKNAWCFTEDAAGVIWAGTQGEGIYTCTDTIAREFYRFNEASKKNKIWQLVHHNNALYAATDSGVIAFDIQNKVPLNNSISDILQNQTGMSPFWGLLHYNDSILFAGSVDKKLCRINTASNTVEKVLGGNINFYKIIKDSKEQLWIITERGIIRYQPATRTADLYGLEDNLVSLNMGYLAGLPLTDGKLLFAGTGGFNIVDPALLPAAVPLRPVITQFEMAGQQAYNYMPHDTSLHLSYNQNSFTVQFATPGKRIAPASFLYFLQGYDKEWRGADNSAMATYSQLPPGNYHLRICVAGQQDQAANTTLLHIYIARPYWQTTWFRTTVILLILLAAGLPLWLRYRYQRQRNHDIFQMQQLEVRSLRAQLNPHFIFNALNSIQYFIIKNNKEAANNYLSRFSVLMRRVLQSSRLQYITVADEADLLRRYLEIESLRYDNGIQWTVHIAANVDVQARIASMMIQPVVENAIVHGLHPKNGQGLVEVLFSQVPGYIVCTVTDNGVGMAASTVTQQAGHVSSGLPLLRERVQLMNRLYKKEGSVEVRQRVEDGVPAGTIVIIQLPVINP